MRCSFRYSLLSQVKIFYSKMFWNVHSNLTSFLKLIIFILKYFTVVGKLLASSRKYVCKTFLFLEKIQQKFFTCPRNHKILRNWGKKTASFTATVKFSSLKKFFKTTQNCRNISSHAVYTSAHFWFYGSTWNVKDITSV